MLFAARGRSLTSSLLFAMLVLWASPVLPVAAQERGLFTDPNQGPPGIEICIVGFGLSPGPAELYAEYGAGVFLDEVDIEEAPDDEAGGSFITCVDLPPDAPFGPLFITVFDLDGEATSTIFLVQAATASIDLPSQTRSAPPPMPELDLERQADLFWVASCSHLLQLAAKGGPYMLATAIVSPPCLEVLGAGFEQALAYDRCTRVYSPDVCLGLRELR